MAAAAEERRRRASSPGCRSLGFLLMFFRAFVVVFETSLSLALFYGLDILWSRVFRLRCVIIETFV